MVEIHQGEVNLLHSFKYVWDYLKRNEEVNLITAAGTEFKATSFITRDGRSVIRFFQGSKEYARAYKCCWGHYYNCNRTRFGMYAKALDVSL